MSIEDSAPHGRIVVGVDGSPQSEQALRWAVRLADQMGASVEAIIAWPASAEYGWLAWPEKWDPSAEARRMLESIVHSVCGPEGSEKVRIDVRRGQPAQVLVHESHTALMVVVGSRGYGTVPGMLLGSVSARVAEHAKCPVLVVHQDTATAPEPVPVVEADASELGRPVVATS